MQQPMAVFSVRGCFLALKFQNPLGYNEVLELCHKLEWHLQHNEVGLTREFHDNEVHFRPTNRSAEHFATMERAFEEYQLLLDSLGFGDVPIIVDGDLLPFDKREENAAAFH